MKTITLFALLLSVNAFAFAQTDEDAVKAAINSAYIGGIHNGGPIDDIRKGFHSSFVMLALTNNEVKTTTLEEWIINIEKQRATNTPPPANKAAAKFTSVAVAGPSASVTLDLYRGDKKVFTDNLLLYKFNDGWKVVAKNFYRHP